MVMSSCAMRARATAGDFFVTPIVIVSLYHRSGVLLHHVDDAHITHRYAANLGSGAGLVFNPGERTDAAFSLLFPFIPAAADVVLSRRMVVNGGVSVSELRSFASWHAGVEG